MVNGRGHQAILRSDELSETLVGHLVEVEGQIAAADAA